MKKNILIMVMLLAMAGVSVAQVIEDFEAIPMNVMLGGSNDSSVISIVMNPDMTQPDSSNWVGKFVRDKDGVPWGGFFSPLPTPIDVTTNKYIHVKVWKSRISPVKFKIEGGAAGNLEIFSMNPQTLTNEWEELVFDFTEKTGTYPTITLMPDFEDPLTLTEDIVIYFDDITLNNDPTPGSDPAVVIEDYEFIKMNMMLGDPLTDSSTISVVHNPFISGIDTSFWVAQFIRDWNGVPWGGFFSPTEVDVTTNNYAHVKVYKNRISPLKFKIEGGAAGNLEIFSTPPQTMTDAWEDIVFDFSSKTGTYPIITFMPDFEDPLTLTENDTIYFDDILFNDNPNPYTGIRQFVIDGKISVYPVPCTDYLTIKSVIPVKSVSVTALTGQTVMKIERSFTGMINIRTADLTSGLYFVTITPESGNPYLFKVVKQ